MLENVLLWIKNLNLKNNTPYTAQYDPINYEFKCSEDIQES